MCDKCVELDRKIEHYRMSRVTDHQTTEGIRKHFKGPHFIPRSNNFSRRVFTSELTPLPEVRNVPAITTRFLAGTR